MTKITRRKLLGKGAQVVTVGSAALGGFPSTGGALASGGLPGGPNTIVVGVWMFESGEETIVATRLREVLQTAITA